MQNYHYKLIQEQFGNKYTNPEQCGQGAFSTVYQCKKKDGNFVAIKVIDTERAANITNILKNETSLLERCDNENVIKLYESAELGKAQLLVLEYCEMDLQKMSRDYYNNKIPEKIVIVIIKQLINGLFYLHKNKIIHRDLKLENIGVVIRKEDLKNLNNKNQSLYDSIFRNASYKLIDFGFAKQLLEETKTLAGSYFNMAPEVLCGRKYSFPADIYSLGVCIYQMITGQYPYQGKSQQEQYKEIKKQKAKFDSINDQLLRDNIKQMLQYDVNLRLTFQELYSSESELVHLKDFYNQNSEFYIINTPNDDPQESLLSQTQEFSVIQIPNPSQIESKIEIIQVPQIYRWQNQKNVCNLILICCKKLKYIIEKIPDKIRQYEYQNSFIGCFNYYYKLVEKLLNEQKKKFNQKSDYSQYQSSFRDSLKNLQLMNYKYQQVYIIQELNLSEIDDTENYYDLLSLMQINNEKIFMIIRNMIEIIGCDMDQQLQEFRCNCYLIQYQIIILYAEIQNTTTTFGDDQFLELKSEQFNSNPEPIKSQLYELMKKKNVNFEEVY
ncbi:unnamed protein product (macronuclear) [Paramecium tetraurelia]|uniref:Protein kinase domain-containing protein n=1 Tax=Paramecium tetraurelia TaxID=5888 RepID=A0DKS5_PARTE|nr:uncharacterized protein GSPATT00017972001 [Paramecium tetraurelia]CAK83642.1 unnamed protein product [Paramecium tetraurelia]|eukprot:XP_001451039.1 hypothetical protein (macronuclear) [Paramecium tetraurelia strain d4-2]